MQMCRSSTTFFTVGSCRTWGHPAAAPPEYRQSAILQNYPLLADHQVKLSRSPAGNQHAGLPSQAILITDQKKTAAIGFNTQRADPSKSRGPGDIRYT
jgi:hypothetical protein